MPHENVLCSWSRTGASRGTRKRGTSANRLRRLGARSRRRVRSSASPVAASTFPPSGLCRSPATRKSHEKSRKNCLPGTDHELYASSESLFPVLGCDKSFVTFRETFVSRRAAETPEGWRLRERQRPSLLESSDARADSNRPPGRFRGCCVFVVRAKRREAPHPLHRAPPSAAGADARPRKSLPRHRAVRDLRPATAAGFQA